MRLFGHHDKAQWSGASSSRIPAFIAFFATLLLIGTGVGPVAGAGAAPGKSPANVAPVTASIPAPAVDAPGMYQPVTPARLLDTRTGTGARKAAVAPRATITVQVTGRGGIPASGVAAVVLNIATTSATRAGYVTTYTTGTTRPATPTVDFATGRTTRNLAIARLGVTGKINLYNGSTGTVHLIADTYGYYLTGSPTAAGAFAAVTPARLLDTRTGARKAAVAPGATITVQITGRSGIPASAVAAALNITATSGMRAGYITAYTTGTTRPATPTLNFAAAQTTRKLAITRVGATGKINLYNGSTGTVHLIADTYGYYLTGSPTAAGAFAAVTPTRLLDTRTGKAAVAPGATITVQVTGRSGIPTSAVAAAVLNITATSGMRAGCITAYTTGTTRPAIPTLDFAAAQTVSNLTIARLGSAGTINLYNGSAGTVNLAADVSAWFPTTTAAPAPTTAAGYTAAFAALPVDEWGAGDGGVSVPVGSRDVWLFGDTFEAHENGFAHSTVVVQRGGNFHVSNAGAQLLPNDDDTHIYWMSEATVVDDNHLYVTGRSVVLTGSGMWDFSDGGFDHTALVQLDNYDNATFVKWISKEYTPVPDPGLPYDLGPGHIGYQVHSHPEASLASGNLLMSMSQNWTDGVWHGWTAYQLIFSEQPAS